MAGGVELVGGDDPADEVLQQPDEHLAVDGGEARPAWWGAVSRRGR
jgi:hypothetical protein